MQCQSTQVVWGILDQTALWYQPARGCLTFQTQRNVLFQLTRLRTWIYQLRVSAWRSVAMPASLEN